MAKNGKPTTMEAEVVVEELPAEIEQSKENLDDILGTDFTSPTKLKVGAPWSSRRNPAYRYYESIAPKLTDWWEEFSNELDAKTGGPKYKTIHQFALAKSKVPQEQQWLEMMIGPEPAAFNWKCRPHQDRKKDSGKWLRVPWLGDWRARRMSGYWAPQHPAKIKSLVNAIKEKLAGFEAVRSAAPFLVQMMARYTRLGEQIDQVFGGQAMDLATGPTDGNKSRFYTYLEMQKAVSFMQLRLLHEWYMAHGVSVNKDQTVQVTQVNQMLVQAGQAGIADGLTHRDLEAVKLAQMLLLHEENFPMTKDDIEAEIINKKDQSKVPAKGNGKVM